MNPRNQQDDLNGAKPYGEPWEVVVPTSLVYLQNNSDLKNNSDLPEYKCTPDVDRTILDIDQRCRWCMQAAFLGTERSHELSGDVANKLHSAEQISAKQGIFPVGGGTPTELRFSTTLGRSINRPSRFEIGPRNDVHLIA
jgi:hypothetical protein